VASKHGDTQENHRAQLCASNWWNARPQTAAIMGAQSASCRSMGASKDHHLPDQSIPEDAHKPRIDAIRWKPRATDVWMRAFPESSSESMNVVLLQRDPPLVPGPRRHGESATCWRGKEARLRAHLCARRVDDHVCARMCDRLLAIFEKAVFSRDFMGTKCVARASNKVITRHGGLHLQVINHTVGSRQSNTSTQRRRSARQSNNKRIKLACDSAVS